MYRLPLVAAKPTGVSVIVLNYNGRELLDRCLRSVEAQRIDRPVEIIVVDNASSDGSPAMVREAHPQVRLLESARNVGFAAGNNAGIRASAAGHVVLLNNDTCVRPGWLAALVECAESDPAIGAVTSKLVFADRPDVIQNAGLLLLSDGGGGDRGTGERDRGQYDSREEVFGFCGAAALLRRAALDDAGLFDESFVAYYEDTDLSWRLRLRGWRVVYEPRAVVEHVHAATTGEWSDYFTFHVDRNRLLMLLKNAPLGFLARSYGAILGRVLRREGPAPERRPGRRPGGGVHLRVLASFLAHAPATLARRVAVRARRRVPDAELLRFVYPRERWDARSA